MDTRGTAGCSQAVVERDRSVGLGKLRIKVWLLSDPTQVVYDNQLGQLEDSNAATAIGGGSIVLHAK